MFAGVHARFLGVIFGRHRVGHILLFLQSRRRARLLDFRFRGCDGGLIFRQLLLHCGRVKLHQKIALLHFRRVVDNPQDLQVSGTVRRRNHRRANRFDFALNFQIIHELLALHICHRKIHRRVGHSKRTEHQSANHQQGSADEHLFSGFPLLEFRCSWPLRCSGFLPASRRITIAFRQSGLHHGVQVISPPYFHGTLLKSTRVFQPHKRVSRFRPDALVRNNQHIAFGPKIQVHGCRKVRQKPRIVSLHQEPRRERSHHFRKLSGVPQAAKAHQAPPEASSLDTHPDASPLFGPEEFSEDPLDSVPRALPSATDQPLAEKALPA